MKHTRIIVTHYGGPDALQVLQEERPEPKQGQVRVRVLSAGVALPDIMAREGIHPETPRVPFTPGWDLVGVVDRLGGGVSGIEPGQRIAAMPISGAYAEFVCLPERELVPVPAGVDSAEAVSLVLNYITAYQMLHRVARVRPGQRVLIHGAAGGVGTALLQLGRIAGLEMYGTCSSRAASAVSDMGGIPVDYLHQDFVEEIHRLTSEGVDAVFDPIGGPHLWHSRKALRRGGKVVGYGLIASIRGEGLTSSRPGRRQRFRGIAMFGVYIVGGWIFPGRKRVVPYSIQTLKRMKPEWFRQDLITLCDLLQQKKIKPLIARRFPLAEARHAHELLGKGGVIGKIVLDGYARESGASSVSDDSSMDDMIEELRSIIATVGDRAQTARRAAEVIRDSRGYRWVGLYEVGTTEIIAVGWTGAAAPAFPRFPVDQGLNGAAVRSARPVVVQDVSADPRYLTTFGSTGAEAIFPVVSPSTGEVIGTIDAESDQRNAFTADDEAFLSECAKVLLPLWRGLQA